MKKKQSKIEEFIDLALDMEDDMYCFGTALTTLEYIDGKVVVKKLEPFSDEYNKAMEVLESHRRKGIR